MGFTPLNTVFRTMNDLVIGLNLPRLVIVIRHMALMHYRPTHPGIASLAFPLFR